ncbi:hypothetical protein [Actinoallomurus iriomotensis]|uniref:Lipoprotein n=1 Tax=Actinoallomurus iriomotensis TaxID=478107 RepID=A0A9W6VY87_9ACTN|nr:hypothetical protein [Actinoallomurus iriomotensis]GLY83407.1 putative lipoprotein [Actinoallomurus iriomotensis]
MIRPPVAVGMVLVLFISGCGGDGGGRKNSAGSREGGAAPLSASQVLGKMVEKADVLRSARGTVEKTSYVSGRVTRMMGAVQYRFKPRLAIKRDFSTPATGFDQYEILLGDAFYMTVPFRSRRSGRLWVEYNVGASSAKTRSKVGNLVAVAQQDDPAMNLRMFTASKNMRTVGAETIYGVPTTHYRGTYSVPKALAGLGAEERARARKIYAPVGAGEVSFDLWGDGRQLPRKIRIVTPTSDKVHWDMTTLYVGFDETLSIKPPPAYVVTVIG